MSDDLKSTWRLILTPPANGAWNMAVDETLLMGMNHQKAQPVLRLYAWNPPCLSLGYAQPYQDVNQPALKKLGWDVVRRPTGGRAILHTDELTYAVIGPHTEPRLSGGVLESYQRLSKALLQALLDLGISVQSLAQPEAQTFQNGKGPVCFEVPSNYEITWQGKKLVGSAQARRKEGVLQHGSLPLFGDLKRITQVLVFPGDEDRARASERLLQRATTAETCLGFPLPWETAAQSFVNAFSQSLDLEFLPSTLTTEELSAAEELAKTKYNATDWLQRV